MPPRAVLIGLPGAGKSSAGAKLAELMGVELADSDELIVARAGRGVGEIFAEDGEDAFRLLEAAAVEQALAGFDGVLALGGGAVTTVGVRQALADSGVPIVLLTATEDELLRRIGENSGRPLLAADPAARLAELAAARASLYKELAGISVQTAGYSVDEVAANMHRRLSQHSTDQGSQS
jgi:shikimate kinase